MFIDNVKLRIRNEQKHYETIKIMFQHLHLKTSEGQAEGNVM